MLSDNAIADLQRSGISPILAAQCGLYSVPDASALAPNFFAIEALVIPYHSSPGFMRVRYLAPPKQTGFIETKPIRYHQPPGTGARAYLPPLADWEKILSSTTHVVVTEGEKKAISCMHHVGIPTIGLGGVDSWRNKGEILPELKALCASRSTVTILYDSDIESKPHVAAAETRLARELHSRGANVLICRIGKAHG